TNGNILSYTSTCAPSSCAPPDTQTIVWTDTTALTSLTETQTYNSQGLTKEVYSWTDAASKPVSVTVNYSLYSRKTSFGCYIPADTVASTGYYPSSITSPEGTYGITYES